MKGPNYSFPAIKGVQAKEEYYTCMIPLGIINKIFIDTDNDAPAEYRAQRKLNETRIPEIKKYIIDNRDTYVFSAIAGSIDGTIEFVPSKENEDIGVLSIDMKSKILINDGQHRKAAICAALEEDSSLEEETIAVVLFKDKGLTRSQQMFTDLNKHAVTTSKSINALYDSKDPCAIITKNMLKQTPFLNKYTDKEKDNLGKFSSMLFTLNSLVNANRRLVRNCKNNGLEEEKILSYLVNYWNIVCSCISEWNELEKHELTKKQLREDYIVTQGITILAFGYLADFLYEHPEIDMLHSLGELKRIDWSRTNEKDWMGCAIKSNGRINRTESGINLTYLRIKSLIGLELTESEKKSLERSKL